MNGSSAGADGAVWFNMGDQDQSDRQDGISGGGANYGYFPSDDGVVIDGFPTAFTTRYYSTDNLSKNKTYYTAWLQVAKWTGDNSWEWSEDTCPANDGDLDSKYQAGIATASATTPNANGTYNEIKASASVDASKFPYATKGTATANSTTAKTTAPTVKFTTTSSTTQINSVTLPSTSGTTSSRRVYYTDPYDQYGAVMASTIQLNYSQSGKKAYFTQEGTTTGFAYGANITGDTDTQQLRAYVTWPSASNAATALSAYSNELTVNDASYTVSFKSENGSATYTTDPSSFQYGHTPEYNGTAPTKTDTANPPVYAYTHDGWSSTVGGTKLTSLPAVTGTSNKTFYAHFSESEIDYTVKFVNNENTEISSAEYHIGDTLTPPKTQIPDTYQSIDKVYYFTGWVGTNNEVYDGTCHGAITYKPVYRDEPRQYTVTFQEEDGTVISSRDLDYGTVPSSVTGLVPALIDKDPDDTNHYTPAWNQSVDTGITGDTVFKIVYTAIPHTWVSDEGVVTKEGTCTEKSIVTKTCSVCNHDVEMKGDYDLTKHNRVQESVAPEDGGENGTGYECFHCTWCDKYWGASYIYNAEKEKYEYDIVNSGTSGSSDKAEVKDLSVSVPAPYFNYYTSDIDEITEDGSAYDYSWRGASLRMKDADCIDENSVQDMRFSGSVVVPDNISYEVGNENEENVITDFGFVFTQERYIQDDTDYIEAYQEGDASQLTLENVKSQPTKFAKMSVVENNQGKGVFTGDNWTGVHAHTTVGEYGTTTVLTFNLVISVKAKNWMMLYSARPYITYTYHGKTYTVYDNGTSAEEQGAYTYSIGAVYGIAYLVVGNNDELFTVRDCFNTKILKNKDNILGFHKEHQRTPDCYDFYGLEIPE